jgi:hypothetical protein
MYPVAFFLITTENQRFSAQKHVVPAIWTQLPSLEHLGSVSKVAKSKKSQMITPFEAF